MLSHRLPQFFRVNGSPTSNWYCPWIVDPLTLTQDEAWADLCLYALNSPYLKKMGVVSWFMGVVSWFHNSCGSFWWSHFFIYGNLATFMRNWKTEGTWFQSHGAFGVYIGLPPLPVRVTTRIITFLVGDPYKPSFATVTGKGDNPRYRHRCKVNLCICIVCKSIRWWIIQMSVHYSYLLHHLIAR